MPKQPSLVIPTGYEAQQRAAERKRKIAEALLAKGLGNQGHMQSWLQVLGQVGTAGAGAYLDKKANKMSDETDEQIKTDYANRLTAFQEKANALDPTAPDYDTQIKTLVQGAQGDPLLADVAKPYADAFAKRLSEQGEMVEKGGQWQRKGAIKPGDFVPNDPNAMVLRGPGGTYLPNNARIIAAQRAQTQLADPNDPAATGFVGVDPMAQQLPGMAAQPAAPAMPAGDEAAMVFQRLDPQEKQIVGNILKKYSGQSAPPVAANVPSGSPLVGGKPPDGTTTDGQPYWLVNGIPYDNPEGR